ncbi:MAG: HEPN domain-containing protein [Planctomycetota bacterium]
MGGVVGEAAKSWAEQSRYDLETARAMLGSERYLYVLFCCQQAVEKGLKALIVGRSSNLPPRIHNLLRLAEEAGVELPDDQRRFFGELSAYYILSRYPEEIGRAGSPITRDVAAQTLRETEDAMRWLSSMPR